MTAGRRLAAVVVAGLVPWIVVSGPTVSVVMSFGLASPATIRVTSLPSYLLVHTGGLPGALLAWPVATLLYAVAVLSAAVGWRWGREDRRLTAGLLVLAGASLLPVAIAVGRPTGVTAVPVGTAVLWLVAGVGYGEALVRVVMDAGAARER